MQVYKGLVMHLGWNQQAASVHNQVIIHCEVFPNALEPSAFLWQLAAMNQEFLENHFCHNLVHRISLGIPADLFNVYILFITIGSNSQFSDTWVGVAPLVILCMRVLYGWF